MPPEHRTPAHLLSWLAGLLGFAAILAAVASPALERGPNPRLLNIAPNTAVDLGRYPCSQPQDNPSDCQLITDYSRLIYDPYNHQFLMFGGGHAATHRTDVDVFDPRTLSWKSAYPSTPCSDMRLANIDRDRAAWRTTGHPIARHTYDMLVVVDKPPRLLLLNGAGGQGRCVEPGPPGLPDQYSISGRLGLYDIAGRTWTYGPPTSGWQRYATAEWDPVSRKVVVVDAYSLWTYDPDTHEKVRHLNYARGELSYGKNLVYFPANQKMYYIADGDAVFEVSLDRENFARSTITRVTGITGDIPRLRETGFAYDPTHKAIGGAVRDGVFYAYLPLTKTWLSRKIETDPPGMRVGSVAFHALDYDPLNGVFVFLTDYPSGWRTWVFRFSQAHGSDVAASRAALPPWPGPSACPAGSRLEVGPSRRLPVPSWAARCAKDGDTIAIDAGVYEGDAAVWTRNNLTIQGVGGRPHIKAHGADAEGKGIWIVKGRDTTIENIEFSGARVPDGNGAAIRLEGPGLTLRHCSIHDNEMGILTGRNADSEVTIEHCEFASNGHEDPNRHNHGIYIGEIGRFTLRYSYVHHSRVGHNVKTRARVNGILYNRIMDEAGGTSSYAVDMPNGGVAYLIGNLIQQGPKTENWSIVSYGAEGIKYPTNELYVVNNTMVNERPGGGVFVQVRGAPQMVRLVNNIFAGPGSVLAGQGELRANLVSPRPGLRDPAAYDYRLLPGSPAIDAGIDPGTANGVGLAPTFQYVHKAGKEPRPSVGPIDIGAYEYPEPRGK